MELTVPGDKSISQRALILAALAQGKSRLSGLLPRGDAASTAEALRSLGARIPTLPDDGREVLVEGRGLTGLEPPPHPLDLGNSGTGARLLLGVLAPQSFEAVLTGDESLRSRPMGRITDPLTVMGAHFEFLEAEGRLPLRVRGGPLSPLAYHLPVASAQLKSALLLAGLIGGVKVELVEPGRSRDHTERVLRGLGVPVICEAAGGEWRVGLPQPPSSIPPLEMRIPGDFSSAAFFLVLSLLLRQSEPLRIREVGLNETRTGLLGVLRRMGADFSIEPSHHPGGGEPVGDLVGHSSRLKGCQVGPEEIPRLIDEVPILAVGAARAEGITRITGARELRVKETDRIRAIAENLRAVGVGAEELEDGMEIEGTQRPLKGKIQSFGDHRIAMAFGVLGALPGNEVVVEGPEVAGVSFPGFWETLARVRGTDAGTGRSGLPQNPGEAT